MQTAPTQRTRGLAVLALSLVASFGVFCGALAYMLDETYFALKVNQDLKRVDSLCQRAFAIVAAGGPLLVMEAGWLIAYCLPRRTFRPWVRRTAAGSMFGALVLASLIVGGNFAAFGADEMLRMYREGDIRLTEIVMSSLMFGAFGGGCVGLLLAKISPRRESDET